MFTYPCEADPDVGLRCGNAGEQGAHLNVRVDGRQLPSRPRDGTVGTGTADLEVGLYGRHTQRRQAGARRVTADLLARDVEADLQVGQAGPIFNDSSLAWN